MNQQINKKHLLLAILLVLAALVGSLLIGPQPISAQNNDATSEQASESADAEQDETTEELKKRIEKVVEEKREQVKGVIEELLQEKTGFIGEVFRISEEALTITTPEGNVVLPISEQVKIYKDNKDLMLEKVEVGNWVIVLGTSENDAIIPDYILVDDDSLRTPNQIVRLGTIQSVTAKEVVIIDRGTGEEKTFKVINASEFEDYDGEEAAIGDFEEELAVLVTGFETEDGIELSTLRSLASLSEINE